MAPGATVLLANRIPLPWKQVYALLPMGGMTPFDDETQLDGRGGDGCLSAHTRQDSLSVGWGILAFVIPLAGWIMYFCWKDGTPKRASQAAMWAWIGFGLQFLQGFLIALGA